MNKFKKFAILLFVILVGLIGYGMYLWFQKPHFEDRPAQIEGLECEEYQFRWYDPEISDTVYSTAWKFKPEQFVSVKELIGEADTAWTVLKNDTVMNIYWSKEITVQTILINDEVLSYIVYWSEDWN